MLKFNLLEGLNKALGFVITALLSRILAENFGTYLYYQTIFGYMYAFALFSSDYNFLVNYKIDRNFLKSTAYYQMVFIKIVMVVLVLLFSLIFFQPSFNEFAFWPYYLSVLCTLFVYDFVLYIENNKIYLAFFRILTQLITLGYVLLFYFKLLDTYYITVIQTIQTVILSLGTFWVALKYMPEKFNKKSFVDAIRHLSPTMFFSNAIYFLLRNFIIFFTTIEIVILAAKQLLAERNIFAEGMRLSGILIPFIMFYINFNINKIKKGYYTIITLLAVLLLLLSPIYVQVFFGDNFSGNTYFYNFFIWVFIFNAFLEKDYIELLTEDNSKKKQLLFYNLAYFLLSVVVFILLASASIPVLYIILLFSVKLLLYYLLLIRKFSLKIRYSGVIAAFVAIHVINFGLNYSGYYQFFFRQIVQFKNQFS